jgi:hypothetical protein
MKKTNWLITAGCLIALLTTPIYAEDKPWETLFDGTSLEHFVAKNGRAPKGWAILNNTLFRQSNGGDIVTRKTYKDFELEFEWKVAEGSNSGVKYRHAEYNEGWNGLEYQILDDAKHGNGADPYTSAAAMYLLAKRSTDEAVLDAGRWNKGKIVARGTKIEHWLNGVKVIDIDIGSDAFDEQLKTTKFKKYEKYGQLEGQILLQDHGDPAWFRKIRIREL